MQTRPTSALPWRPRARHTQPTSIASDDRYFYRIFIDILSKSFLDIPEPKATMVRALPRRHGRCFLILAHRSCVRFVTRKDQRLVLELHTAIVLAQSLLRLSRLRPPSFQRHALKHGCVTTAALVKSRQIPASRLLSR